MSESILNTDNLGANGDAFYNLLMDVHGDLSEEQSNALNVRLVLIMANEIGDFKKLAAIIKTAGDFNRG